MRIHWFLVVAALATGLIRAGEADQPTQSKHAPPLYGFCMEMHDAKQRSLAEQVALLRNLGFDGVGYPLWLNDELDKNLAVLDQSGLDLFLVYTTIDLSKPEPVIDPQVLAAIGKLKGRPVTVSVLLRGYPPGDPRGEEPALKALCTLGDAARDSGLRISIYHHTGDWTESLLFALQVVRKVDHPQVGVNFNLCHWLMIDGDKEYAPVLQKNADKLFAVTINGRRSERRPGRTD